MSVDNELRKEVGRYLQGQNSLSQFRAWLERHVRQLADTPDATNRLLNGQAWLLLSEYDYGHRTEDEIRTELAETVPHLALQSRPGEELTSIEVEVLETATLAPRTRQIDALQERVTVGDGRERSSGILVRLATAFRPTRHSLTLAFGA